MIAGERGSAQLAANGRAGRSPWRGHLRNARCPSPAAGPEVGSCPGVETVQRDHLQFGARRGHGLHLPRIAAWATGETRRRPPPASSGRTSSPITSRSSGCPAPRPSSTGSRTTGGRYAVAQAGQRQHLVAQRAEHVLRLRPERELASRKTRNRVPARNRSTWSTARASAYIRSVQPATTSASGPVTDNARSMSDQRSSRSSAAEPVRAAPLIRGSVCAAWISVARSAARSATVNTMPSIPVRRPGALLVTLTVCRDVAFEGPPVLSRPERPLTGGPHVRVDEDGTPSKRRVPDRRTDFPHR